MQLVLNDSLRCLTNVHSKDVQSKVLKLIIVYRLQELAHGFS
jgi:hypothetical protein